MTRIDPTGKPRRGLRGAWWIVVAGVLFFVAVAIVQLGEVRHSRQRPSVGDGKDPATYGFDLASLTISPRWLAAAMPRDRVTPLDWPPLLDAAQVDSLNRAERGKYLVGSDLVIGVVVAGVARAYPLRVLHWHEVVNDTLGGMPIAVAWHPLSGAAVVLDRRHDARELSLGVSGLVWNSHHLLYDRDGKPPSLWAPILGTAVAGPAAGDTLAVIPSAVVAWERWRRAHPATTAPWPDPAMRQAYKRNPYGSYQSGDVLRYPVAPLPPLPRGERLMDLLPLGVDPNVDIPTARAHAYRFLVQALGLRSHDGESRRPAS
jgi:hypothetical protein